MALALGTASIIMLALVWQLALPRVRRLGPGARAFWERSQAGPSLELRYDPGRELRAEQRARDLLRSCVNVEEWAMYRDLGFLRLWGTQAGRSAAALPAEGSDAPYAYLIYPHEPLVAYVPKTGALLNEYCVAFPDQERPYGSARLPDSDDVLAKWMALKSDERRLIGRANMHLPGRQIDPQRVARDLQRLARWERERSQRGRAQKLASVGQRSPLEAEQRSGLGHA